jgi:hypothetical protein
MRRISADSATIGRNKMPQVTSFTFMPDWRNRFLLLGKIGSAGGGKRVNANARESLKGLRHRI